jgi:hypothetical protein
VDEDGAGDCGGVAALDAPDAPSVLPSDLGAFAAPSDGPVSFASAVLLAGFGDAYESEYQPPPFKMKLVPRLISR